MVSLPRTLSSRIQSHSASQSPIADAERRDDRPHPLDGVDQVHRVVDVDKAGTNHAVTLA